MQEGAEVKTKEDGSRASLIYPDPSSRVRVPLSCMMTQFVPNRVVAEILETRRPIYEAWEGVAGTVRSRISPRPTDQVSHN